MEQSAQKIKNFLLPSSLVALLYVFVSFVLVGLLNVRELWNISIGAAVGPISSQDVSPITNSFDKLQDKMNGPAVFLFWLLVGCVAYGIVWLIQNVFMVAGHEVQGSQYMSGGKTPQQKYWRHVLTNNLYFVAATVALIVYLGAYLWLLLPACANLFYEGVYNHFSYKGLIDCASSVLLNAFAMYFLAIFLRVTRYRWHTIRPNI